MMNINDFNAQINFCEWFNGNIEDVTVHQLHTFLDEYYKNLLHFKRDLTIAAYSKSKSDKYGFLSVNLLQNCINALLKMNYKGYYSTENDKITSYLIDNCISALKEIAISFNKLNTNNQGITFNADDDHKQKVLALRDRGLGLN